MAFRAGIGSFAFAICVLAALSATPSLAQQVKAGDLVIDHAWTRATPGGADVGIGYLTIENKGRLRTNLPARRRRRPRRPSCTR